jgi:hypothetical protein
VPLTRVERDANFTPSPHVAVASSLLPLRREISAFVACLLERVVLSRRVRLYR